MIQAEELTQLIQSAFPDADIQVLDKTGMQDHYIVGVTSSVFAGIGVMERHRKVYDAVDPALKDGRLHAIEIKTIVK